MENKVSCSSGRAKIIDPNMFDGQSSFSNVPVANEDLNISVVLSTYKKGRTILTTDKEAGTNTSDSSKTVNINFIDGSNINGKKVLTTNYTDLTTAFDELGDNSGEGLGITSIDIDFNSQQAPMISINFVDVRGTSIFQNEANIKDGKNKYSTFFQLPYPLFKLTIKGYYGLPVEYCLHMYKFNSKFNSQTGNFEITANFIGFTYAMLSDMLIGYLKAIPYTKIGESRYKLINDIRNKNGLSNILNLNELMIAISNINESIKKISADDLDAAEINNVNSKLTSLTGIMDIMVRLGNQLDIRGATGDKYDYIIKPDAYKVEETKILAEYKDEIKRKLVDYNTNSLIQLDTRLFDLPWYFPNSSKKIFKQSIAGSSDVTNTRGYKILQYLDDNVPTITENAIIDVWDLTDIFIAMANAKTKLEETQKIAQENLGETIRLKIKDKLNFDPTIRNIMEIFTTAVEVFMESIYSVADEAERDKDKKRGIQLKSKFTTPRNSDLKNPSTDNNILAWPGYRERKDIESKEAYIEKYIGSKDVLEKPLDVQEIAFIEDLLNAFLKAASQTDLANVILNGNEVSWFPINPVDTKLFDITKSPYTRIGENGLTSYKDVANLMLIRAMTFLGYNNTYLSVEEIQNMAELEANSMIAYVGDDKVKQAISNLNLSDYTKLKGKINDKERNIIKIANGNCYYDYFPVGNTDSIKIIPISDGFSGTWTKDNNGIWSVNDTESVFLSNFNNNITTTKKLDGATYVKILTAKDYDVPINLDTSVKPDKVDITKNELILEKLKTPFTAANTPKAAGFNVFGGVQGIQEFVNLDYGSADYDNLPLRFVFFNGNSRFGLAKRLDGTSTTIYDLDTKIDENNFAVIKNSGKTPYFDDSLLNSWDPKKNRINEVFSDIGRNWNVMNDFDPKTTSYPFVESQYTVNSAGIVYDFSLFGSRLYYAQSQSRYPIYAKALLYLSTVPFNGLFDKEEIKRLFDTRAGFIHAPKLWAAYVGGLLWRIDVNNPIFASNDSTVIIGGGSGTSDPLVFKKDNDVYPPYEGDIAEYLAPATNQFFDSFRADFTPTASVYKNLPRVLFSLPEQVKDEFKKVFFNFVNSSSVSIGSTDLTLDFKTLNSLVQLVPDGSITTFDTKLSNLYGNMVEHNSVINFFYVDTVHIKNNFSNTDKYQWIIPLSDDGQLKKQLNLMFKGVADNTNTPVGMMVGMFMEEVVIANSGYFIWTEPSSSTNNYSSVYCSKNNFDIYFNKVLEVVKLKISSSAVLEETKKKEQAIFGTSDVDAIKFQLYKTCKNVFDKWIGGATDIDNILFQCGGKRNSVDEGLKQKYRPGDTKSRLIDSFRFVDRAFNDIGDLFYLNPSPVNDYLINSPNTSIYDAIGQLLASNNFNFIPLPTYINYNDDETLASVFSPNPFYENAIKDGICGPSFVSVYAGESSKHLDFADSEFPNDGIDFVCGGPDGKNIIDVPADFTNATNDYQNDVAIFSVNYSQQNQNIFKDISLDQSEFSETDESLKISDDIANKGSENNVSLGGQNIYNVYSVRSYKAEVEMLGNPMIQPMMHFQLNNIPMFHGAYLVTRVKHSIKPNFMSTVFSGSRVRYPKTELLSGADFYMAILDSMNMSNLGNTNTTRPAGTAFKNSLGKKCGEYVIAKPIIDGVSGFEKSKPIRDLVASVESQGNYDAYNNGEAGKKGTIKYKPSEYTIARIKELQAMQGGNRIFAVGKYQLIPSTFNAMVKSLKLSPNTIFDAKTQERAGEWLILKGAGYRKGLRNYFSSNNTGSEEELQKAIDDLALEFASFPRYFQYKTNTTVYGGSANNPTQAKFCAQDVAKALIETWGNLNNNKTPNFTYDNLIAIVKNEDRDVVV